MSGTGRRKAVALCLFLVPSLDNLYKQGAGWNGGQKGPTPQITQLGHPILSSVPGAWRGVPYFLNRRQG